MTEKRNPAKIKFTLANHTTPPGSTNIDILGQGTVPILLTLSEDWVDNDDDDDDDEWEFKLNNA